MSVFDEKRDIGLDKAPRNKFILSKNSHVDLQFGRIMPIYCEEVLAGDSFRISPKYGCKFEQMVYPCASVIHQYTYYFYVPYSILWKRHLTATSKEGGWAEFISDANQHIKDPSKRYQFHFPYIKNSNKNMFRTGSLFDCLGLPTTLPKSENVPFVGHSAAYFGIESSRQSILHSVQYSQRVEAPSLADSPLALTSMTANQRCAGSAFGTTTLEPIHSRVSLTSPVSFKFVGLNSSSVSIVIRFATSADGKEYTIENNPIWASALLTDENGYVHLTGTPRTTLVNYINSFVDKGNFVRIWIESSNFSSNSVLPTDEEFKSFLNFECVVESNTIVDAVDANCCPFISENGDEPRDPISAMAARAYEAIYNSYFRRIDIDPYVDPISGVVTFDSFCNTLGGADTYNYDFHMKRLPSDRFTSADLSPMLYDAPIVQIVNGSNNETKDSEISINVSEYSKDVRDVNRFKVKLSHGDIAIEEDPNNSSKEIFGILKSSLGKGTGITIRDLQNARAMEKYLSACMRIGAGYSKYLRKIHGTGSERDDNFEINIPRYLGGTSTTIDVQLMSNSAETDQKALGEYIGTATSGDSGHISCYCKEHGIILGVMTLIPELANADLKANHWRIPVNELSYPNSQTTHLQPQAITYRDMCPVIAYKDEKVDSKEYLDDAFGYNDIFGEYKESHDEVHGLFRKDYADYCITRQMATRPMLTPRFLEANPDHFTDPFIVSHKNGSIGVCHINFEVEAMRPLPRAVIPQI